jgi:hypothetical protein
VRKQGRISFYSQSLSVGLPGDLTRGKVNFRGELMGGSEVHPNYYASDAILGGPAVRLGAMVTYISRDGILGKCIRGRVKGEQNVKRTNSLVDLLERVEIIRNANRAGS